MDKVVEELKKEPVGIDHIRRACPNAKVMLYDKIPPTGATYDNLTRGKKCLIILYMLHARGNKTRDQTGHYALLQREGSRMLYFSSYGFSAEQEIAATHSSGRILALLGPHYVRNTHPLQRQKHTATCGRWCILKARLHDVPMKMFNRIFGQRRVSLDPDSIACLATMFLVG